MVQLPTLQATDKSMNHTDWPRPALIFCFFNFLPVILLKPGLFTLIYPLC